MLPVEVGCRGFVARSTMSYLDSIGLRKDSRAVISKLEREAKNDSSWIWQRHVRERPELRANNKS